jgi:hypothetical protein
MARYLFGACAVVAAWSCATAKPIAFADGTTVMAEYGAGTMQELQVFYAPQYYYSVGGGHVDLTSDVDNKTRHITYARLNALLHRWNLDAAQGNLFAWGGVGSATGNTFTGSRTTWNGGLQADYETRRVYASFKSDLQYSSEFSHRIDTVQLGLAPYEHRYGGVATWFLLQGREYTGGLYPGLETAVLLRLFKGGAWIEAGVTNTHKLQAMVMLNF